MKKIIILLTCAVFAACAFLPVHAAGNPVIVISYAGEVKIIPAGKVASVACRPDMLLAEGTRIVTGEESYVAIALDRPRSNIVKIKENSEVVIKLDSMDKIELIDGKMFTLLRNLKKGRTFRVQTPCAVCGARGTGWCSETDGNITTVAVFKDKVFVRGVNRDGSVMEKEFWVGRGFERKVKKFEHPGEALEIPEDRLLEMEAEFDLGEEGARKKKMRAFDRESAMREEQMKSLQDRKDDARRDKTLEKRSSGRGYKP